MESNSLAELIVQRANGELIRPGNGDLVGLVGRILELKSMQLKMQTPARDGTERMPTREEVIGYKAKILADYSLTPEQLGGIYKVINATKID